MPIAPASSASCSRSPIAAISSSRAGRSRSVIAPTRNVECPTRQAALIAAGDPVERGEIIGEARIEVIAARRRSDRAAAAGASSRVSGARLTPQLPVITVVTPWLAFAAMSGVANSARSSCVCTSIKPGATILPGDIDLARARRLGDASPTAAIRSPAIATSPRKRGPPVPSITVAAAQDPISHSLLFCHASSARVSALPPRETSASRVAPRRLGAGPAAFGKVRPKSLTCWRSGADRDMDPARLDRFDLHDLLPAIMRVGLRPEAGGRKSHGVTAAAREPVPPAVSFCRSIKLTRSASSGSSGTGERQLSPLRRGPTAPPSANQPS